MLEAPFEVEPSKDTPIEEVILVFVEFDTPNPLLNEDQATWLLCAKDGIVKRMKMKISIFHLPFTIPTSRDKFFHIELFISIILLLHISRKLPINFRFI